MGQTESKKRAQAGQNEVQLCWLGGDGAGDGRGGDGARLEGAEVVRLIIDESFAQAGGGAGQRIARAVTEHVGCRRIAVVTPAGFLTAPMARPSISYEDQAHNLRLLEEGLGVLARHIDREWLSRACELGQEWLVGMDGYVTAAEPAPLQTLVKMRPDGAIGLSNAAVKMYPMHPEARYLLGWWLTRTKKVVEPAIMRQVWELGVGTCLALVCHEGVVFSGRSIGNLKDRLRMKVRQHLMAVARTKMKYVVFAGHQVGPTMHAFKDAARYVSGEAHATVVTTLYAPAGELDDIAQRHPPYNKRDPGAADKVVTLLVRRGD